jgi:hypothetical protein
MNGINPFESKSNNYYNLPASQSNYMNSIPSQTSDFIPITADFSKFV